MRGGNKFTLKSIKFRNGMRLRSSLRTDLKYTHKEIFKEYYGDIDFCQKCGRQELPMNINIHHIDRNHSNNDPLNMIKLCIKCHTLEHIDSPSYKMMKVRCEFITGEKIP